MIRTVTENDANAIADIYNHYIINTAITFEEQEVSRFDILERISTVKDKGLPWLVAEDESGVIGYAYATEWRNRSAYRFTVESAVYLSNTTVSKGWGTQLYNELFSILRRNKIKIIIGGITLPNVPSISLHEKFGMKKVAHFEDVGFKFGKWHDVGFWQIKLDTANNSTK